MAGTEKAFLGTGWRFPVCVDPRTGRIRTASYEEDIAQSIRLILSTRKVERVMQPEFGCDLHRYLFANIQEEQIAEIRYCVKEALRKWEPRIIEVQIRVNTEKLQNSILQLEIQYTVRATNTPYNLVYPFYISEGT